jgi:hypothetical protein
MPDEMNADLPVKHRIPNDFPCTYLIAPSAMVRVFGECFTKWAGSLGVQPEVESADTAGVLMGGLLLLDVLAQDVDGRTAAA